MKMNSMRTSRTAEVTDKHQTETQLAIYSPYLYFCSVVYTHSFAVGNCGFRSAPALRATLHTSDTVMSQTRCTLGLCCVDSPQWCALYTNKPYNADRDAQVGPSPQLRRERTQTHGHDLARCSAYIDPAPSSTPHQLCFPNLLHDKTRHPWREALEQAHGQPTRPQAIPKTRAQWPTRRQHRPPAPPTRTPTHTARPHRPHRPPAPPTGTAHQAPPTRHRPPTPTAHADRPHRPPRPHPATQHAPAPACMLAICLKESAGVRKATASRSGEPLRSGRSGGACEPRARVRLSSHSSWPGMLMAGDAHGRGCSWPELNSEGVLW